MPYAGARVSRAFHERWLSGKHVGTAKPAVKLEVRRGHFHRRFHSFAEAGAVGYAGHVAHSKKLWYSDWHVDSDWEQIVGVKNVRTEQSFDNKGVTAATIDIDNMVLEQHGSGLGLWHSLERGFFSPLRGFVYPGRRRDPQMTKNAWYMKLPNAQVRVWFGYGEDALECAFVGLIDDLDTSTQGQAMQITARDFGGVMIDENVFGWGKDRSASDPVTFIPKHIVDKVRLVGGGARATSEQPGHPASGVTREGEHNPWWGGPNPWHEAVDWVDIKVPAGRYRGIYFNGDFDNQDVYIGFYMRPRGSWRNGYVNCAWQPNHGTHFLLHEADMDVRDYYTDVNGNAVPCGWVDLGGGAQVIGKPGFGDFPVWHKRMNTQAGKGTYIRWGGTLLVGQDSFIRVAIKPLPNVHQGTIDYFENEETTVVGNPIHRAGIRRLLAERVDTIDTNVRKLTHHENYISIGDVSEIAETVFRWCGFKEWEVEPTGVSLKQNYVVGKDKSMRDIIDDLQKQTGYVFFMGLPSDNGEASTGRPIFRQNRVWEPRVDHTEHLTDRNLLEDVKVKWSNQDERHVIRVRGKTLSRKHGGRPLWDDSIPRAQYTYDPPWGKEYRMAGVVKQLTHYDPLLETIDECHVAALLIALQIAFTKWTAIVDIAGTPGISLDSFLSVTDRASGTNGRLYVSNVVQEFTAGQDAKYTTELGGSLPDSPDVKAINHDYWRFVGRIDLNDGPYRKRRQRPAHKHKRPKAGTFFPGADLHLA